MNIHTDGGQGDGDLSVTIGDLSIGGLLDMTCSGLLSSPDNYTPKQTGDQTHDEALCSCFVNDDDNNTSKVHDKSCSILEQQAEEGRSGDGLVTTKDSGGGATKDLKLTEDVNEFNDITSPSVPTSVPVDLSLFKDDSFQSGRTRFLNERAFNNSSRNHSSSYRFSFSDSTQFYSLAAGNLKDFEDDEEDEESTALEDQNGHDRESLNSTGIIEIHTDRENVSYKTITSHNGSHNDSKSLHNGLLDSDGDIDVDKFHHEVVQVEHSTANKDKLLSELIEVLEQTVKAKEAKEKENEELLKKVEGLEEDLKSTKDEVPKDQREHAASPTTETYSSQNDSPNSAVEDLKLQILNLEKKLEADRKYLEDQTVERELERDDFQKTITCLSSKIDDMEKEKERFEILISNQKTELEDYEIRLKESTDEQQELFNRIEKLEDERKSNETKSVVQVHELREIIQSLEVNIDRATQDGKKIKEENQILREDLERSELLRKELEQLLQTNQEVAVGTANTDITEELQAQVEDLVTRLERKLSDMDNFPWSTRPSSSCSGAVSVSNEDISVCREVPYINKESVPLDLTTLVSDALRRLDAHFESLVRFDEIIMKKLQDSELRLIHSKKCQEDLENEKQALQERINSQIMDISDYKNRLDQFRFEPSPNAVTLSGLRGRVSALTGEVEELKGQLHLKQIEMQDLTHRLAGKEALLTKLSMKPPEIQLPPPVKMCTISVQTEVVLPLPNVKNSSFTQTVNTDDHPFKKPKLIMMDVGVQTKGSRLGVHAESLELSSIQGNPPPTHSTPNDPAVVRASVRHKSATKFTDDFDLERSPEVLREPRMSRLNNSIASNKYPTDLKEPFDKYGSEYGEGHPTQMYDHLREPPYFPDKPPTTAGTNYSSQSNSRGASPTTTAPQNQFSPELETSQFRSPNPNPPSPDTRPPPITPDSKFGKDVQRDGKLVTHGQPQPQSDANPGSNTKKDKPDEKFRDGTPGKQNQPDAKVGGKEAQHDGKTAPSGQKGQLEFKSGTTDKDSQPHPDDNVPKSGKRSHLDDSSVGKAGEDSQYHPHENLTNSGNESQLDDKLGSSVPGETTRFPFEDVGNSAEGTRADKQESNLGDSPTDSPNATSSNSDPSRTQPNPSVTNPATRLCIQPTNMDLGTDDTFTFELETICDFEVDRANGKLNLVCTQGKIITSDSSDQGDHRSNSRSGRNITLERNICCTPPPPVCNGTQDTAAGPNEPASLKDCITGGDEIDLLNTMEVNWDMLKKSQEVRMVEAEARVEAEVLKTQIDMLKQALEKEKEVKSEAECLRNQINMLRQALEQEKRMNCEAQILRTQIDVLKQALEQEKQINSELQTSCNTKVLGYNRIPDEGNAVSLPVNRGSQSRRWFELYLRAKSYRKALAWQKKYLALVVQGYKDLMCQTGLPSAFEHPDLFQKEVPITPSSIGLCDRRKGKTRFRIVGRVVIAVIRMKYMVKRWDEKVIPKSVPAQKRVEFCAARFR